MSGVAHEITHGPSFAMLRLDLTPGQTVVAEAGAMVARHANVGMQVKLNAGRTAGFFAKLKALFIALVRRLVGGETFFVNHFTADGPGSVWVAPTMSGMIAHRRMNGEKLALSAGAYVAHAGDVDMRVKWGGFRTMLAKEGVFMLEVSGVGDLWFTSYGGIHAIDVDGTYVVDNGHLVGYEGGLTFRMRSAGGGFVGLMASGEGIWSASSRARAASTSSRATSMPSSVGSGRFFPFERSERMNVEIIYRPAQAMARVALTANEAVVAESGAMVGMSSNVHIETQSGGLLKGLKRVFGGESFFRNTFTAHAGPGEVLLAHKLPGDMVVLDVGPPGLFIQSASYVASTPDVEVTSKVGGFRTFFAGEGVFVLKATSQQGGRIVVGAFGGIEEIACDGRLVIDTGHLVAWDATLEYSVGRSARGWMASLLSGEGLVCHFRGRGRVFIQTRNPSEYGRAVGSMLPPRGG